jgi:hypothetical protein
MIDLVLTVTSLLVSTVILFRTFRILGHRPHRSPTESVDLPLGIPVCDIGIIERDLINLKMVIVVAHKVEVPTSTLAQAVEHNFARGVKYIFLISNDHAEKEINGYYKVFEGYAQVVIGRQGAGKIADLLDIQKLPYNWDDYPYIFSKLRLPSGEEKTLAFRGDELHEGIAKHYGRVDPVLAHTIARAIVSEAPKSLLGVEVEREQFDAASKVIEFSNGARPNKIQ